jgi:CO/xanthine dehydrogenase FAD-binding subunit
MVVESYYQEVVRLELLSLFSGRVLRGALALQAQKRVRFSWPVCTASGAQALCKSMRGKRRKVRVAYGCAAKSAFRQRLAQF